MELNQQVQTFSHLHAKVVAVTTDPLVFSSQTAQQYNIQYPIVYDPNHAVGTLFHVYNVSGGMDMGPVDTHSIFIIDANGVVRWEKISAQQMHVSVQSVLAELRTL